MTLQDALVAGAAAIQQLPAGLQALQAVLSADLYEDIHEILINQISRLPPLLLDTGHSRGIHFCDRLFKELFEIVEGVRASHGEALDVIASERDQAFCLYLRNFEVDRSGFISALRRTAWPDRR